MARHPAEIRHTAVVAELDEERAATLGRAHRHLEMARDRGLQVEARMAAGDGQRHDLLAEYRDARRTMEHWRWVLGVQREAIGLYDHTWVDRLCPPLPPR